MVVLRIYVFRTLWLLRKSFIILTHNMHTEYYGDAPSLCIIALERIDLRNLAVVKCMTSARATKISFSDHRHNSPQQIAVVYYCLYQLFLQGK